MMRLMSSCPGMSLGCALPAKTNRTGRSGLFTMAESRARSVKSRLARFVGGETAGEPYRQGIPVERFDNFHHPLWRGHVALFRCEVIVADILYQFGFLFHARLPEPFVRNLPGFLPGLDVVLFAGEALREIFRVHPAHAGGRPGRKMNAVGNVAYVEFVVEIARPYTAQNLLAYLTEPTQLAPLISCDMLLARTLIENFSDASFGFVLPRLMNCSQVMPSRSG